MFHREVKKTKVGEKEATDDGEGEPGAKKAKLQEPETTTVKKVGCPLSFCKKVGCPLSLYSHWLL